MNIQVKDLSVAYRVLGNAGPWVTLAHSHCANHAVWEPLAIELASNFRVLCFDSRGHGKTTATPPPYTMSQLADDAFQLLNALGIKNTHWVGQAMGAMIGQALAIEQPQAILSLVLADSTLGNPEGMRPIWAARNALASSQGLSAILDSTVERWFVARTISEQPELIEQVKQMILQTPIEGYVGGSTAMATMDMSDSIGRVRSPTLVMVGAHDPATPIAMSRAIQAKIADSDLVILPDCSHMSYLEQPVMFNQLVRDFLSRIQ